jgi:transposase
MIHADADRVKVQPPLLGPVLGCDVGKFTITVHSSRTGKSFTLTNTEPAIADLIAAYADHALVMEATGGYELALASAALAAGMACIRLDPRRAWAFTLGLGHKAKTDALDAAALAEIGRTQGHRLARFALPSEPCRQLRQLAGRRSDLIAMRTAEQNRLKGPQGKDWAESLTDHLAFLDRQIARIDEQMTHLIAADPDLARKRQVLVAIKSIGPGTAHNLLASLPELGTRTGKQITALTGLAPYARDSGTRRANRKTGRGRSEPRRALFMAALSAIRFNPQIRAFYQRLVANGKKPKLALIAAARKLLVIANAKLRDAIAQQS